MSAKYKITIGFSIAAIMVIIGVMISFYVFGEIKKSAEERKNTYILMDKTNHLLYSLIDAETGQRGYLLTGNESFLEPYNAAQENINSQLAELHKLSITSAGDTTLDKLYLNELTLLINTKMAVMKKTISIRRSNNIAAVSILVRSGEGKKLMDSIRDKMNELKQMEEKALTLHDTAYQNKLQYLFIMIVVASLLALLTAISIAFYIYKNTQKQIKDSVLIETQYLLKIQEETNQKLQQVVETLQVSEEKLAVTLYSIGDAVITTDAEGNVTLLNPLAEQLTGWKLSEVANRPIDEIFHIINQETRLEAAIPIKETLANGTIQGLANHTVLIAREGTECAIADSCAPIRNRKNEVVGAVLVFRDVTEEYAAQQALRNNATLIQTILNSVVDGVITIRVDTGTIETVNPSAERMFGYNASEIIEQNICILIPEINLMQCNGTPDNYDINDNNYTIDLGREVTGLRKDGSEFPMEISLSEMWMNGQRYLTGILRDLTFSKKIEADLQKAGTLQTAIFNSANFSSIATDEKGVIQVFNVGAERMLGYIAAEVVDKVTPADISDPQEVITRAKVLSNEFDTLIAPGFEALVFKASREIEDIYELTYIRKDGSRFPAVVSVTALRDDQGEIIGYLLIGTDNSARKKAEQALQQAGALQNAIFNSANFSSIATDEKGVIQIFNVGAERMLGYSAIEVVDKITPADISDPLEVITRAKVLSSELNTPIAPGFEALVFKASREIEDIYELTYIRKDGSRFPAVVSVTALRNAENDIIGYLLIGTDNTARKQIEAEQKILDQRLRDQQFYTRSLFESNIDAIMTTDLSGIITDVNKQMETLTDCTRDELIGAPFKNYFTDPDRAEASIKLVLNEKKVTNYELTACARDGKETVVSYNATTFYDRDRKLQGVFAAARDVTELKRFEQTLKENNAELEIAMNAAEKANLAKSDFLSSMSHELRSPLNAILGFAQLMESDSPLPTTSQQESIDQILQAGWHLLKLINEILDLAKIESGKLSLSLEPISINEVLLECKTMLETQAMQRNIEMTFPNFDKPCFIHADRTRIKQVIINLLSNAIKYNRPNGTVTVNCFTTDNKLIRISVKDTGEGLSPEQLAQLFQPFNRLGQENTGEEGTGIGLVVAKQLMELMNGNIGVESIVGEGSKFWIDLIADDEPQFIIDENTNVQIMQLPLHENARQFNILYVEDNPANMKLIEQLIARRHDLHLLTAETGYLGIEIARNQLPDMILMDINLPDISGIEALKILHDDIKTKHIPIVALSANAMPRDIDKGLAAGFFRYLTKPINVNEFMDTIHVTLEYAEHFVSNDKMNDGE